LKPSSPAKIDKAMSWFDSDFIVRLLGLAAIGLFLWIVLRPRYEAMIRIEEGECRVTQGKLTASHLQIIAETCAAHGVRDGWIGTQRRRGQQLRVLRFSVSIPDACRQQLRNLWPVHA